MANLRKKRAAKGTLRKQAATKSKSKKTKRPAPQKKPARAKSKPKRSVASSIVAAERQLARRIGLPREARLVEPIARDPDQLSIIIEAEPGISSTVLRRHLEDVYGDVILERLFPQYRPGQDIPSMQNYHVATLPNVSVGGLLANPYDIGYAAIRKGVVAGAEPDVHTLSSLCKASDAQLHNGDERWSLRQMRVPEAWILLDFARKSRGGGIKIGQPDTGLTTHELLVRLTSPIAGFDEVRDTAPGVDPLPPVDSSRAEFLGHGTQTASIIAADPEVMASVITDPRLRDMMMSGIAPDAVVWPYRVTRSVFIGRAGDLAKGIAHAVYDNCDIISISLGGTAVQGVWAAIRNAYANNMLICCAAGQCEPIVISPAVLPQSISVLGCRLHTDGSGAIIDEKRWKPSAWGKVEIAASAEKVWNCLPTDPSGPNGAFHARVQSEGTSFAAPAVAAIGALWLKFHEDKGLKSRYSRAMALNRVFKQVLKDSARRPAGWLHGWGPGIVDAGAVLNAPLPPVGPRLSMPAFLMQHDQPDLFALFEGIFWDQPAAAVHAVLGRMLNAATPDDLRRSLHQFGGELILLMRQAQERFDQVRDAVAAEAQGQADRAREAAQNLAESASHKLRSVFG